MLVHQGHSQPGAIHGPVMAKAEVERWFTAPGVRRIRLKEGGVRGSLFLPPGEWGPASARSRGHLGHPVPKHN